MNQAMKEHIIDSLRKGIRLDGRKPDEFRPVAVTKGVVATAEGSAEVTCGETRLIVGVKMDLGTPYPDRPDSGTLMVGTELRPMSNPSYELGPPTIESIETARVIDRGVRESGTIDEKSLCITPGEKVWMVNVDVCPLNDDGNLIDLGGLGAIAALQDTKLPGLKDGQADYKNPTKKGLKLSAVPVPVTVVKIGETLLVDPTDAEWKAADARLTITSLEDGSLCALQKGGDAPLTIEEIDAMTQLAVKKAKELRKLLG